MRLVQRVELFQIVNNKRIYLDNDFLGLLYEYVSLQNELIPDLAKGILLLDYLTKFEFLRDVYLPQQKRLKEEFVEKRIFTEAPNHQEIFIKLQENALILSQIYAHKNCKSNASIIDLILAARLMLNPDTTILITGNRKDYPAIIFDILTTVDIEESTGQVRCYYLLAFNRTKFNTCFKDLQVLLKGDVSF